MFRVKVGVRVRRAHPLPLLSRVTSLSQFPRNPNPHPLDLTSSATPPPRFTASPLTFTSPCLRTLRPPYHCSSSAPHSSPPPRPQLNPYINYPFLTLAPLRAFMSSAHAAGARVKLYYTVRELSTSAPELWAFRAMRGEVVIKSPVAGGNAWLREHLRGGYDAAWHEDALFYVAPRAQGSVCPSSMFSLLLCRTPFAGQCLPFLYVCPSSMFALLLCFPFFYVAPRAPGSVFPSSMVALLPCLSFSYV
eukprot:scaffold14203_cov99-Isochrysis_galbana.AAC.1